MTEFWAKLHNPEFYRFLVAGGVNVALTYLIYAVLAAVTPYQFAYGVSYTAGIGISYLLNAYFVFRQKYSLKTFFRYPLVYVVQYLLGCSLMYVGIDLLSFNKYVMPFFVIILTIPVTFMLSRFIIKGKESSAPT